MELVMKALREQARYSTFALNQRRLTSAHLTIHPKSLTA
jgi:hypothetical protein